MNRFRIAALLLIAFAKTFAQDRTIYLDSLQHQTETGKHRYYRVIKDYEFGSGPYVSTVYYASGKVYRKDTIRSREDWSHVGWSRDFYENGKPKAAELRPPKQGITKVREWYEDGKPKLVAEYIENPVASESWNHPLRIDQYWTADGAQAVKDGEGSYTIEQPGESEKGPVRKGLREGQWTGSLKDDMRFEETYANGNLVKGKSYLPNGTTYEYTAKELKPEPKDGINAFYQYIGKHFKMPKKNDASGRIVVAFTVMEDGHLDDFKIVKSVDPQLDEEALRVLRSYKERWTPGTMRGRNVKCSYVIPIKIAKS